MKRICSISLLSTFFFCSFCINADASIVRGKRYYIQLLKKPCNFNGDKMGKHHTKDTWRAFYKSDTLGEEIKAICPNAPLITSKKKLRHLYHFLESFASDSGNIPSCN
jgi:hypothetical protein